MAVSRFPHLLLLCGILRAIEGERPQQTQRRSRGLFVSDLPVVLSPQMASSPAMSREDSLATAVFRFLGTVPDEPPPDSCLTNLEVDFAPFSHPPLEHWFYMTSSPLPSLVRTEPIFTVCFAPHQPSGTRSQSSTRLELNFCGDSSLYASPKVVSSPFAWIFLNGFTVFLRRIFGDLSYGTVEQPSFVHLWCSGLLFNYEWAWPIRSTKPASPSRSFLKPNSKIEDTSQICMVWSYWNFSSEISGGFIRISPLCITRSYLSFGMKLLVRSSDSVLVRPSSSFEEKLLLPYPLSMERGVSSVSSVCFSFLIGLLSCGAVSTGPEDAIETTLVFLVDEDWTSTSYYVTIPQLYDFVVKAPPTHLSIVSNPLSSSIEDLSCLVYLCFVCYAWCQRGWLIPSIYCIEED
uniref:Uncharacterized protein n=1 Tax=Brassica campestris TaxID=3711 RepID=M4D1Z5_BRACM